MPGRCGSCGSGRRCPACCGRAAYGSCFYWRDTGTRDRSRAIGKQGIGLLKIIGLICVAASGIGAGVYAARRLRRRVRVLGELLRLLSFTVSRIRYTAAPVQTVLREAADSGGEGQTLLRRAAACAPEQLCTVWEREARSYAAEAGLSPEETELLTEFGSLFGKSDRQSLCAAAALYETRVTDQLRRAQACADEKGRLYISLGVSGGLCAVLLLI